MSDANTLTLAIPVNDRDHAIGPVDASVIVVNYGDYECPDCHRRHREIEKTFDQLMNTMRFIYRHCASSIVTFPGQCSLTRVACG
jgi:protein-disulfide isomerase